METDNKFSFIFLYFYTCRGAAGRRKRPYFQVPRYLLPSAMGDLAVALRAQELLSTLERIDSTLQHHAPSETLRHELPLKNSAAAEAWQDILDSHHSRSGAGAGGSRARVAPSGREVASTQSLQQWPDRLFSQTSRSLPLLEGPPMYKPMRNRDPVLTKLRRQADERSPQRTGRPRVEEWPDNSAGASGSLKAGRHVHRLLPLPTPGRAGRVGGGKSGLSALVEVVRTAIRRSATPLARLLHDWDDDGDGKLSLPEFARVIEYLCSAAGLSHV